MTQEEKEDIRKQLLDVFSLTCSYNDQCFEKAADIILSLIDRLLSNKEE
jgi:hypothetical protein